MSEDIVKKGGRPKGSKNKPKRGRPKKEKEKNPVGRPKKQVSDTDGLHTIRTFAPKEETSTIAPSSENEMLDSLLDDDLLNESLAQKQINQNPLDDSYYYRGSKNIPVAGAQYEFTADMVKELQKCKEDITYFAENFFYIVNLNTGKQKIELYDAQRKVLQSLVDNRFVALLSCRQSGKSTLLTIFALWMVCFNEDYRIAIVANKETTAINIFKRVRMAYEQLPNYIKPGVKDYGKTGMTLGNDSSIVVSTTTATSIRGDSLNCVCLDEAAFIEPHLINEFWASVIPSISSGKNSKVLMVSTPNGVGNKFYEMFSGAENGSLKQWKSERVDWWHVPGRDEEWKQTQIELLGSEEKFLQEYGNTFLDDASTAVGALVIERFKQNKKPPIWTSEDGEYIVFEYPDKDKLYVIGVDVGEGIGRASSVAQVLDVTDLQNIQQVAVYGSTVIEPYHFANKLSIIGQSWGLPPMLIERNNCGAQVIDALYYKHNYEKIASYTKISEQDKYNKTRNLGVLSHTNIRFDGIQNMRYWINHLQCVHINDTQTITEFETFVRQPNGFYRKRNDNFFDDRVMALVWAMFILEPELCEQYFTIEDYDLQHKPLRIKPNGYWENFSEYYNLRELNKLATIVPNFGTNVETKHFETIGEGITSTEAEQTNKYDLDIESLYELGYEIYT
jgi:hypothetical protein